MQWSEFLFFIRHFSVDDEKLVEQAFEMGKKAHDGQKRQSGEPYFTHPIAVAQILAQMGSDRDTIIAALLHDTVEDTSLTLKEIEQAFGPVVKVLIDGATKLEEKDVEERPTLDEKIETLRKMFTLMQRDVRIMVIKLADRLHNMQTLGFRSVEKQQTVAKETLDIYVKIADRLCMRDIRDELEILCREILEPELVPMIINIRKENQEIAQMKMEIMKEKILGLSPKTVLDMRFEKKSYEKLRLQYELQQDFGDPRSFVNVAFRCNTIDDCYHLLGLLHQLWPRETLTFEDFINIPVINGYKGLHTIVIMDDGIRVRCKIRTYEMDAYAHNGIASMCFDSKAKGVLEYLPWTKRISPLSNDTENKSSEFWDTLQSDILSDSILVYGPSNRSILVPTGGTALDAALYMFPDEATRLTAIRINGKQVPLSHKIEPASRIEITTGTKVTLHRDWLYWVQTGLGIAMIREQLGSQSSGNMQDVGKMILQQALTERGAGYVEEFDSELIRHSVFELGYNSIEDAYVAIANRHLEPSEVIGAFEQSSRRTKKVLSTEQKQECTFYFSIDRDVSSIRKLLTVYERYNVTTKSIGLRLSHGPLLRMKVSLQLTAAEQEAYRQELIAAGAQNVTMKQSTRNELALMAIVVICWGLNPVWAKYFLTQGVSPLALVSIRSMLFFVFSTTLFIIWRYMRGRAYSPIPRAQFIALAPAISTFVLSLMTYLSISQLSPSVHLTILRFNIVALPLIHFIFNRSQTFSKRLIISLVLFIACITGFLLVHSIPDIGILFALMALVSYVAYSLITEHTMQENKIGVRYPYFLFHVGLILGILGLAFMPWILQDIHTWKSHIYMIILYVFVCVFIPHTCFHIILQRVRFRHVTGMSLFEVPMAIALEALILGLFLEPAAYVIIGIVLLAFTALIQRRAIR